MTGASAWQLGDRAGPCGGRVSLPALLAAVLAAGSLGSAAASAQVRVSSSVSQDTIGLNESLEYRIHVSGPDVQDVPQPDLSLPPGLTLFGRSKSSELSIVNGSVERRLTFVLVFRPYRLGPVQIGPARVRVGQTLYQVEPSIVTVVPPRDAAPDVALPQPLPEEELPEDVIESDDGEGPSLPPVFVTNRLDKHDVYVGEQVLLTFSFYQSPRAMVLDQPNYASAKTPGFWTQDFNREPEISRELIGGEPYTIQRFYYALFPLTPGEKAIAPATLTLTLRSPSAFFDRGRTRTLAADTLHLTVKPLPATGRPADFSGAVGRYQLHAEIEGREVERNAPATVVLTVSGEGNIATVPPPRLGGAAGLKTFDPVIKTHIDPRGMSVAGEKEFRYLVIPSRTGRLDLGTATLAYFDPATAEYRTSTASLGTLLVREGTGAPPPGGAAVGSALAGIREGPVGGDVGLTWRSPLFWGIAALPLVVLAGLVLGRSPKLRRRPAPAPRLRASVELRRHPDAEALARVESELVAHLQARHGVGLTGLPHSARQQALLEAGTSPEYARRAAAALAALESVRFAPPAARASALREALAAVRGFEETEAAGDGTRARLGALGASTRAATLGAGLLVLAGSAGQSASHPQELFGRANHLYMSGDVVRAEELYRRVVRLRPESVAARYNLGNALQRQGRDAEALQQYLGALRRAPRDARARNNVALVRSALAEELPPGDQPVVAAPLQPPLSWLSPTEVGWVAVALFYALCTCAAAAVVHPRRRLVALIAGGCILLAAGVFAGAAARAWSVRTEALVLESGAVAREGPAEQSPSVLALPAGAGLRVRAVRPGWAFVSLPNGLSGWVARTSIGFIP